MVKPQTLWAIYNILKQQHCAFMDNRSFIKTTRGVGQGYVTSPTLFNCYTADLLRQMCQTATGVKAYADDIAALCRSYDELVKTIKVVEEWCEANDIGINKAKSGIIHIRVDKRTPIFNKG